MPLADARCELFIGMQYGGLVIFSLEVSHAEGFISVGKKSRQIYAHELRCHRSVHKALNVPFG